MGMEFRPYYFAKEWVKAGHKVDIIAADYSHIRRVNPEIKRDFETTKIDGINYHWIKTITYDGNGVKRSLTMAKFILKLISNAKWIADTLEPDVVICSSTYPLDTYVGQRIRKVSKKKVKLIHEVHDMWPISPIEIGGMSPKHPFIRIMQRGENSFCKNSDIIVSLLPSARDYFIEHGMNESTFRHVPNGVVLDEWKNYSEIPEDLSRHFIKCHNEGKFNLCFFGSIHKTYNLDMLIDAVKQFKNNEVQLTLIGPGNDKEELKKMAEGCNNIRFFNSIPKSSIPDLFNYIDSAFVGAKSQKIFRFGICMNKLFDSMMGGKPILYMVDAPNNYVEQYNCGVTIKGQTTDDLIEGIRNLIELDKKEAEILGVNGRNAAVKEFNYTKLSEKFLEIMKED